MDIDRFLATNQPVWDRLAELCRGPSAASAACPRDEIDELVRLYQRTSTHLSYARTYLRRRRP